MLLVLVTLLTLLTLFARSRLAPPWLSAPSSLASPPLPALACRL